LLYSHSSKKEHMPLMRTPAENTLNTHQKPVTQVRHV
jgi:hypothetical protein